MVNCSKQPCVSLRKRLFTEICILDFTFGRYRRKDTIPMGLDMICEILSLHEAFEKIACLSRLDTAPRLALLRLLMLETADTGWA